MSFIANSINVMDKNLLLYRDVDGIFYELVARNYFFHNPEWNHTVEGIIEQGRRRLETYGHCMSQATVEGIKLWQVVNGGSYARSGVIDERHVQMINLGMVMERAALCIEAERSEKEYLKALLRKTGYSTELSWEVNGGPSLVNGGEPSLDGGDGFEGDITAGDDTSSGSDDDNLDKHGPRTSEQQWMHSEESHSPSIAGAPAENTSVRNNDSSPVYHGGPSNAPGPMTHDPRMDQSDDESSSSSGKSGRTSENYTPMEDGQASSSGAQDPTMSEPLWSEYINDEEFLSSWGDSSVGDASPRPTSAAGDSNGAPSSGIQIPRLLPDPVNAPSQIEQDMYTTRTGIMGVRWRFQYHRPSPQVTNYYQRSDSGSSQGQTGTLDGIHNHVTREQQNDRLYGNWGQGQRM